MFLKVSVIYCRDKGAGPSTSGTQPSSSGDTGAKTAKEKPDFNLSHGKLLNGTASDKTFPISSERSCLLNLHRRRSVDHNALLVLQQLVFFLYL